MSIVSPTTQLLSRDEAAKFLGIKTQTLAVWATTHRHHLPYIKMGSKVKYRLSDLEEFLSRCTVGGPEQDESAAAGQ